MKHINILFSAKILLYPESKMNSLINNAGYSHVTKKIFMLLDGQNLLACRLTCQSWKINVEQPDYLIEKCKKKGQPKELEDLWIDLLQKTKQGTKIEHKVVQCLMKWSIQCHLWKHLSLDGFTPAHIAAQYGCLGVVQFISKRAEILMNSLWMPDERLPIHLASAKGHTEVVKFLASKIDNLNVLDHYGNVPMHYAAANGHLEIVKFIASKVENPNFITNYGMCPFKLACRNNHNEVIRFLFPYTPEYQTNSSRSVILKSISFTFGLKCAWKDWKESKKTFDFFLSSTYVSFFNVFVLEIILISLTLMCNFIRTSIPTFTSGICHTSEQYDNFHSLNVTHASLTEITDEKLINSKTTFKYLFFILTFIYLLISKLTQYLLHDCYCGKKKFLQNQYSLWFCLCMPFTIRPFPEFLAFISGNTVMMFLLFLDFFNLRNCPKHYMHQHM